MNAPTCDTVREHAPDFALGALTGRERADVLAHLDHCPACQALVGEYATVADALLDLVPEADPPGEITPPVLAMRRRPEPRRWRRRAAALAAAAVLAIVAGTGAVVALRTGGGSGSTAATSTLRSAPMIGAGDRTVGRVVATGEQPPKLAVSVDYWVPDGSYQLRALDENGTSVPVGSLQVSGGRGTWTGRAAAVEHPVAVTLVDQAGDVVCRGRLA